MKANSRRRVLISSVAMLLVALVALSTATFAWFTQNTTSTADGIYAKTVKASSLVLSKADHAWDTKITYAQGTEEKVAEMLPASSIDGENWFQAVSDNETTCAAVASSVKAVPADGIAASNAKYVLKQELNVKNDGTDGTIKDITITWSYPANTLADYVRVAIVPKTATISGETGKNTITANGTFKSCVYAPTADTYDALVKSGVTEKSITTLTVKSISVPDLAAQDYASYDLYMWFEGQDSACIDANVGQMLAGITFTVSGTPE